MVESFWAVPDTASFRTPLSILREQAAALTERTNGALVGTVGIFKDRSIFKEVNGPDLVVSLSVEVPALDNYVYRLLQYRQPVDGYPGRMSLAWDEGFFEVRDEAEFVSAIKDALSSDRVRQIVGSLLSQATAA